MKHLIFFIAPFLLAGAGFAQENLAQNGSFNDLNGWSACRQKEGVRDENVEAPGVIALETRDTGEPSTGALRVRLAQEPGYVGFAHTSGALCALRRSVQWREHDLKVSFRAKSIAGSPFLNISRFWGGGILAEPIELSKEWKAHEAIVTLSHDCAHLIFNLVESENAYEKRDLFPVKLADGEFLLGAVVITEIEKRKKN